MNVISLNKNVAAALLGLLVASSASAGLIGDTVGTRYYGTGGDTGVQNAVVGAGDEGNFFSNQFYNYGDFDFAIRSNANFGGIFSINPNDTVSLELSSLNFPGPLTGVTFQTNLTGVSYVLGANMVTFTWNEQVISQSTYLTAQFNAGVSTPDSGSSLLLLGLGLVGLYASRRVRK